VGSRADIHGEIIACALPIFGYVAGLFLYDPYIISWLNIGTSADVHYWLVAAPVAVGFVLILAIGSWIGWTMATTPPPKPIEEITRRHQKSRPMRKPSPRTGLARFVVLLAVQLPTHAAANTRLNHILNLKKRTSLTDSLLIASPLIDTVFSTTAFKEKHVNSQNPHQSRELREERK
jgi:hypothetical protein